MEVRVALEHHAAVRIVLRQHEWPGADRIPVERQVLLRHSRLVVETVDLARHRRKERHRQPVHELRIFAVQADAVGMAIDAADAGERKAVEVDPGAGRQLLRLLLQRRPQLAQTDDALGHHAEDRRMQPRVRQPLDLVDVVVGGQLAAAAVREVAELLDAAQLLAVARLVPRLAGRIQGESRMRLIADSRADADLVDADGDRRRRRVGRQLAPAGVEVAWHRHRLAGQRNQRIGPLQVVVLQRRLVDLRRERDLVLGVGLHRIEMLRAFGERGVENVAAAFGARVRIVLLAAAGTQQQRNDRQQGTTKTGHGRQFIANRVAVGRRCPPQPATAGAHKDGA
ncbi:MAG: hypothetical protein AW07_01408 [Candidatus Accumulibacter sp. SK-11]|nr:MAG: hypothetical protein AW07_01408 [Candidatus Accumulibacter sp. SK-11]